MSSYFSYLHLAIKGAKVQKNLAQCGRMIPPPYGSKVHKSGGWVQKNRIRNRCQKQIPSPSKRVPSGPTQINPGPQKLSPQGPGNTHASLPHFSCPQVQKKMARSKKHVQVQKKAAKVQKTRIPCKALIWKEVRRMLDIGSGGEIIFVQSSEMSESKEVYKSNFRQYGQMKKQSWEESEKRSLEEERRSEKRKSQKKEDAGARKR